MDMNSPLRARSTPSAWKPTKQVQLGFATNNTIHDLHDLVLLLSNESEPKDQVE